MSYDIGDLATVTAKVTPADATTAATLTMTDPTGATSTPAVTKGTIAENTVTFTATVTLDSSGVWVADWDITGTGTGTESSVIDVDPEPTESDDLNTSTQDAALATLTDLHRLGYTSPKITPGYVMRASTRIRSFARQKVSKVVDDTVILPMAHPLYLPQRPVISVSKVEAVYFDDTLTVIPASAWQLRNNIVYGIGCRLGWHCCGADCCEDWPWNGWYVRLSDFVKVTYTHGYDPIPDDIVDVVGSVAERIAHQPKGGAYVTSHKIDDFAETFGDQTQHASGLLPGEENTVKRILGVRRSGTVGL